MSRGLFITATGTDVGKTYITGLLLKKLRDAGLSAGYYKAALSGAELIDGKRVPGDADFVRKTAGLQDPWEKMVSYIYDTAVSPHLASRIEGNPVDMEQVKRDYRDACSRYEYVAVEGSGGIVCPIRWDEQHILLEDIIRKLSLPVLMVADAALGSINAAVLTAAYAEQKGIHVGGIILNRYHDGSVMEEDNRKMIEEITGIPVIAAVGDNDTELHVDVQKLTGLFK